MTPPGHPSRSRPATPRAGRTSDLRGCHLVTRRKQPFRSDPFGGKLSRHGEQALGSKLARPGPLPRRGQLPPRRPRRTGRGAGPASGSRHDSPRHGRAGRPGARGGRARPRCRCGCRAGTWSGWRSGRAPLSPTTGRCPGRGAHLPLAQLPPAPSPGRRAADGGPGAGGTVRAGILRRGAGSAPTALGGRTRVGGACGAVAGDGASRGPDLTSRAGSERFVALST